MKTKNTVKNSVPASEPPTSFLPTGVSNLDEVLGGGLACGALVLIMGLPGSGKTTLANQIAFATARRGAGPVLILTALSEPTSKVITHLSTFTFFDQSLVGGAVQFLSVQHVLPHGLKAVSDEVITMARSIGARMIVLDGFRGMRGNDGSPQEARQFLYDVGATLGTLGVMTVITSEADPRDPTFFPETTAADVILGMHSTLQGVRQRRGLEVVKARGAAPLAGLHAIELTNDGVVIYPQLEGRVARAVRAAPPGEMVDLTVRSAFGIPDLDALLGGGLPTGTATLLAGSPGAGKTVVALHFALAGVRAGEHVVYLSFHEDAAQLQQLIAPFAIGAAFPRALTSGSLTLLAIPALEVPPDAVADRLFAALDQTQAHRLIIDNMGVWEDAVMRSSDPARLDDFLNALLAGARLRHLTTLLSSRLARPNGLGGVNVADRLAMLAENMLLFQNVPFRARVHRVLAIGKMRYEAYDDTVHEYAIAAPAGLRVLAPFMGAVEIPQEEAWTPAE
jgi:circadian clock protein KaiC